MFKLFIAVCWWRVRYELERTAIGGHSAMLYFDGVLYTPRRNIRCSGVEWTSDSRLNLWEAQYHVFNSGKHSSLELMSCSPIGFRLSSMTTFVTALLIHIIFPVILFRLSTVRVHIIPRPPSINNGISCACYSFFLSGAFAKLLKATVAIFVGSVRVEHLGCHRMNFY